MKQRKGLRNISDVDLRLLRVFVSVAEAGGFGASEVELGINRSTISTHIADLEARLGMKLCNRSRGRADFSLTAQGGEVYDATMELLERIDGYRVRLNTIQSDMSGRLRLAIPDDWLEMSGACFDLAGVIAKFRQQAPGVEISIAARAPNEVDFELLNGAADLGITTVHASRPGLQYLPIFSHVSHLYCSQRHPLFASDDGDNDLESIVACSLATFRYRAQSETEGLLGLFSDRAYADHMEGCLLLVLSGAYLGFLPDYYAQTKQAQYAIRQINPERFNYRVNNAVALRNGARENPAVALFLAELEHAMAAAQIEESAAQLEQPTPT